MVESYLCSAITGVLSSPLLSSECAALFLRCACIFVCAAAPHDGDGISRSRSSTPQVPVGTAGANWRVGAGGQLVPVGPRRGKVGISFPPRSGREGMTWSSGYVSDADRTILHASFLFLLRNSA